MKNAETMSINHVEPIELIDWLSQGESCTLEIGGTSVTIRLVDRKGRRARISVSATQRGEAVRSSEEVGRDEESFHFQ